MFMTALLASSTLLAATIKGKLLDENNEPMIGANIVIQATKQYAVVGLDGTYVIHNVSPGNYSLTASYIGYSSQDKSVTINSTSETVTVDFGLQPDKKLLDEVVVTAKAEGGSDIEARKTEKNSSQVVNIVSAKTIEISPDITVANVIQRVSGVSLVRNASGDPQYAIVRGMDKRYNYNFR